MQEKELRQLIEKGLSTRKIAEALECSQTNVRYWLKKFKLKTCVLNTKTTYFNRPKRPKRPDTADPTVDWEFIQKEYDSGETYRSLRKKHGLSMSAISKAVKVGKLKTRSLKDAAKRFVSNLTEEERKSHFKGGKGNPNGKMGGYREKAGRSKKYYVKDSFGKIVCLQSSYEKETADILDDLNIIWIRPKHLKYGNQKYFPDFYLPEKDLYLDPKNNYLAKLDQEKIKKACEENKVLVLILTKDKITKKFLNNI